MTVSAIASVGVGGKGLSHAGQIECLRSRVPYEGCVYCPTSQVTVMFIQLYTPGIEDKSKPPKEEIERSITGVVRKENYGWTGRDKGRERKR